MLKRFSSARCFRFCQVPLEKQVTHLCTLRGSSGNNLSTLLPVLGTRETSPQCGTGFLVS